MSDCPSQLNQLTNMVNMKFSERKTEDCPAGTVCIWRVRTCPYQYSGRREFSLPIFQQTCYLPVIIFSTCPPRRNVSFRTMDSADIQDTVRNLYCMLFPSLSPCFFYLKKDSHALYLLFMQIGPAIQRSRV